MTTPYTKIIAKGSELVVVYNEKPEPTTSIGSVSDSESRMIAYVEKLRLWQSNMKECKFFDKENEQTVSDWLFKKYVSISEVNYAPSFYQEHLDNLEEGIVVSCISIKGGFAFFEPEIKDGTLYLYGGSIPEEKEPEDINSITIQIDKTSNYPPYMATISVNGIFFKEMGGFNDPAFALSEIEKNDDLREVMRPDLYSPRYVKKKQPETDLWPSDEELKDGLAPLTPQSKGFYFEQRLFGAKWLRDQLKDKYTLTPKK